MSVRRCFLWELGTIGSSSTNVMVKHPQQLHNADMLYSPLLCVLLGLVLEPSQPPRSNRRLGNLAPGSRRGQGASATSFVNIPEIMDRVVTVITMIMIIVDTVLDEVWIMTMMIAVCIP